MNAQPEPRPDSLDAVIPPLGADRSRLYLGVRTVTGRARVSVHDVGGLRGDDYDAGTLGGEATPDAYDWGGGPGPAGYRLASALLADAAGRLAARRLWREFAQEVVRLMPPDEWELSAVRIQTWVARRLAPRAAG